MANLGKKIKIWSELAQKGETEKFVNVFNAEWKKSTKELIDSTPEGRIRFALFNRHTILRKLVFKLGKKKFGFYELYLDKKMKSESFFYAFMFERFTPYGEKSWREGQTVHSTLGLKNVILFYANNIESQYDCAKELFQYWFETFILEKFAKDFELGKSSSLIEDDWYTWYDCFPILDALKHFKIFLSEDEQKQIFTELCEKHGLKLKDFTRGIITICL